ncbi:GDSL esterase/lipase At2g30310-like [Mercurialis annua]|uniref:GDSL esterase/lipase At2g30310-like n=1 Tax=Mercurialis annua TaxID=3986 RepID=UPI002160EC34|nr:GDSL esterase/lipase At2g30310-like [Mercurialis annua]
METTINIFICLAIFLYSTSYSIATNNTSLPKFPAVFFFGDSIFDTGNNNYIKTIFRANYRPYGQDINGGVPTGRFSNGKLIPDMLASVLGIKDSVPPYLDPNLTDDDLITGVNFASSSGGFDERTSLLTNVIPVSTQVNYFNDYITRLKGIVGEKKAMEIINSSLVVLDGGTNDFNFNIFDIPARRFQMTATQYIDFLLNKEEDAIRKLYDLGVRSFIVAGILPIGSLPLQTSSRYIDPFQLKYSLDEQNKISLDYNKKLISLLIKLQQSLPTSKLVYTDLYFTILGMITHPAKYGFEETKNGCCGSLILKQGILCDPITPPCKDPSKYLFWDRIHPTSTAYGYIINFMVRNVLPKFLS